MWQKGKEINLIVNFKQFCKKKKKETTEFEHFGKKNFANFKKKIH